MKIVYLPSTVQDISWFRNYCISVFPAGDDNAKKQFFAMEQSLRANPYLGHPAESHEGVRELHIPRTPFTVIYRITDVQIEVLRLWDEREGGAV